MAVLAGCGKKGPPTGDVRGRVAFNGKPVADGYVTFENLGRGRSHAAQLEADGQFVILEVEAAEYAVVIEPPAPKGPNEATSSVAEIRAARNAPPPPDRKDIPMQFRSSQTSPLKRSVVAGDNEFDFDLSAKSPR